MTKLVHTIRKKWKGKPWAWMQVCVKINWVFPHQCMLIFRSLQLTRLWGGETGRVDSLPYSLSFSCGSLISLTGCFLNKHSSSLDIHPIHVSPTHGGFLLLNLQWAYFRKMRGDILRELAQVTAHILPYTFSSLAALCSAFFHLLHLISL